MKSVFLGRRQALPLAPDAQQPRALQLLGGESQATWFFLCPNSAFDPTGVCPAQGPGAGLLPPGIPAPVSQLSQLSCRRPVHPACWQESPPLTPLPPPSSSVQEPWGPRGPSCLPSWWASSHWGPLPPQLHRLCASHRERTVSASAWSPLALIGQVPCWQVHFPQTPRAMSSCGPVPAPGFRGVVPTSCFSCPSNDPVSGAQYHPRRLS